MVVVLLGSPRPRPADATGILYSRFASKDKLIEAIAGLHAKTTVVLAKAGPITQVAHRERDEAAI
jgi:hypothetical protein